MTYDKKAILKKAISVIRENKIKSFQELSEHLCLTRKTMYRWSLHKHPDISGAISNNIVVEKSKEIEKRQAKKKERENKNKQTKNLEYHYQKGQGYVYVINCKGTDFYKIGMSKKRPLSRVSSMQTGCPFELDMIHMGVCDHYSLLEKELHKRYAKHKVRGEWFKLTPALLLCVKNDIDEQKAKQLKLF